MPAILKASIRSRNEIFGTLIDGIHIKTLNNLGVRTEFFAGFANADMHQPETDGHEINF
jgi:hypothetical protein